MATVEELLGRTPDPSEIQSELWTFRDRGPVDRLAGRGVYNPSAIFIGVDGTDTLIARTEGTGAEDEFSSRPGIFRRSSRRDAWDLDRFLDELVPELAGRILQDPSACRVGDQLVVSLIDVELLEPDNPKAGCIYRPVLLSGPDVSSLQPLLTGPHRMKGVRVVALPDGRLGVFTRPQSDDPMGAGAGKIGFLVVRDLAELRLLTPQQLSAAPLIAGLFPEKFWGGVNDVVVLPDGRLGVLAHLARFTPPAAEVPKGAREYYPLYFTFDWQRFLVDPTGACVSDQALLLGAADIRGLGVVPKRPDLLVVSYPAAFDVRDAQWATRERLGFVVGIGDAAIAWVEVPNPVLATSAVRAAPALGLTAVLPTPTPAPAPTATRLPARHAGRPAPASQSPGRGGSAS